VARAVDLRLKINIEFEQINTHHFGLKQIKAFLKEFKEPPPKKKKKKKFIKVKIKVLFMGLRPDDNARDFQESRLHLLKMCITLVINKHYRRCVLQHRFRLLSTIPFF